ncbi:MAG TPA: FecR family protein [Pseudomonas sp.]|uniref:FecR family protein n=1 Tax=Pseudomonas sp. TaxID=306 RepID=UPI002EDABDF9
MSIPNSPDPSKSRLSDEAAHWCMRVHESDFGDQERERFDHWLASDPAHKREFDAMMEIWTLSEFLPTAPLPVPEPDTRRRSRRPLLAAALLALGLPLIGFIGWEQSWIPSSYQRYQSDASIHTVTLPDGSRVQLNLASSLSFANFKDRRSVTLNQGEAYFEVTHDANHPFIVNAGQGQIRVTGTHFNVWTYRDQVVVTLTEGSVKVINDRNRPDQAADLSPGMQASYDLRNNPPQISVASAATALAWRDGKLILDDLTLSDALPRINAYLNSPIRIADRNTAQLRIGGIYNTSEIAGLVQNLPKVLPVSLNRNDEGETVIRSNPRYAP